MLNLTCLIFQGLKKKSQCKIMKFIVCVQYHTLINWTSFLLIVDSMTISLLVSKFIGLELRLENPVPGINSCSK